MPQELLEGMKEVKKIAEMSIKDLALARAIMLKTGANEEDVTDFITRTGEKYGAKYDEMSLEEILIEMTLEIVKKLSKKPN